MNQEIMQFEKVNFQTAAYSNQFGKESTRGRTQQQSNLYRLKTTEDNIRNLSDRLQSSLVKGHEHSGGEYERRKWHYGFDIHEETRKFVDKLQQGKETFRLCHDFDYYPPTAGGCQFYATI